MLKRKTVGLSYRFSQLFECEIAFMRWEYVHSDDNELKKLFGKITVTN